MKKYTFLLLLIDKPKCARTYGQTYHVIVGCRLVEAKDETLLTIGCERGVSPIVILNGT